jgi:holo-[acyl-carrier protein] synthase
LDFGVGIDIVEIARVGEALTRTPRLAARLFTPAEREYCGARHHSAQHFAARFAAKEAIAKAFGRPLRWQEVEITNDGLGKPEAVFAGNACAALAGRRVLISLSHSGDYATAVAMIVPATGDAP